MSKKKRRDKNRPQRLKKKFYEKELARLQFELVKWQYWIKRHDMRVMITFDGRDAAGKGGTIKRIMAPLQPRDIRLVALGKPSDRELTQWYFQRYVTHLPAAGEMCALRPQLVQPRHGRTGDGLLHRPSVLELPARCPEFRAAADP